MEMVESESPDLVMVDSALTNTNTLELITKIRGFSDVPLIIISESEIDIDIAQGLVEIRSLGIRSGTGNQRLEVGYRVRLATGNPIEHDENAACTPPLRPLRLSLLEEPNPIGQRCVCREGPAKIPRHCTDGGHAGFHG